jgi:type IV pilus assembly protein PilW
MRRSSPKGFTLIELMIAGTVAMFVMMGVSMTFISQAQQYQAHAGRRGVQHAARLGLGLIENELRNAGYGVDPDLAIIAFDSYDAELPGQGNDFPDAVSIHSRDPDFSRRGSLAGTTFNFTTALTQKLRRGQILLLMCAGAQAYMYGVVSATTTDTAASVTLHAANTGVADTPVSEPGPAYRVDPFAPPATPGTVPGCLSANATALKVNRSTFFVRAFTENTQPVPYLMLHRGIDVDGDNDVDADDAVPVSAGVEQLQLSYVMQGSPTGLPTIVGTRNAKEPAFGMAWRVAANAPTPNWREAPYTHASRQTSHPANIRQVRVTLIARSTNVIESVLGENLNDPAAAHTKGTFADGTVAWKQLENLGNAVPAKFNPAIYHPITGTALPATQGLKASYLRVPLRVSVSPKNLLMRSQFLPPNNDPTDTTIARGG